MQKPIWDTVVEAPGSQDAAVEHADEDLQELQAHGHVASVLLEEKHSGPAPDGLRSPCLGVHEPRMQPGTVLGFELDVLQTGRGTMLLNTSAM